MSSRTKTIKRFRRVWVVLRKNFLEDPETELFAQKTDAENRFLAIIEDWISDDPDSYDADELAEAKAALSRGDCDALQEAWDILQVSVNEASKHCWIEESKLVTRIIPARGYDVVYTTDDDKRQVVLESFSARARAESFIGFRRECGDERGLTVD